MFLSQYTIWIFSFLYNLLLVSLQMLNLSVIPMNTIGCQKLIFMWQVIQQLLTSFWIMQMVA